MNHFAYEAAPRRPASASLEWKPDIERLRREIDRSLNAGGLDHLALAEAECWIDLIDAELVARRNDPTDVEVHQLKLWRAELQLLVGRARRSASSSGEVVPLA